MVGFQVHTVDDQLENFRMEVKPREKRKGIRYLESHGMKSRIVATLLAIRMIGNVPNFWNLPWNDEL